MKKIFALVSVMFLALSTQAFAVVAPAAGSLGYDIYDIVVVQGLQGAFGYVAGALAVAYGAYLIIGKSQFVVGVPALIGGGLMIKADTIAQSLGALIG